MQEPILLFFICGVLFQIAISSVSLFSAYLDKWIHNHSKRLGITQEDVDNMPLLPHIPHTGLAAFAALGIMLQILVALTVLLGPGIIFTFMLAALFLKASELGGTDISGLPVIIAMLFGVFLCRVTIGKLVDSIVKDIESSIDADDDPTEPTEKPDPSP